MGPRNTYVNIQVLVYALNPDWSPEQSLRQANLDIGVQVGAVPPVIVARRDFDVDEHLFPADGNSQRLSILHTWCKNTVYQQFWVNKTSRGEGGYENVNWPAGTATETTFLWTFEPLPSHSVHGYLMCILVPWQRLHVLLITNGPVLTVSWKKNVWLPPSMYGIE